MESTSEIQTTEKQFISLQALVSKVDTKIDDPFTYEIALDGIFQAKEISKRWASLYEEIRAAQVEALDATYAAINKVKKPCEEIVKSLSLKCNEWDRRQKQIARDLEIKANEAAKKAAEESILKEAEHAAMMGDVARSEAILATPPPTVPIIHMPTTTAMPATLSRKARWKAEIYDLPAFIRAVADKVPGLPSNALEPNMAVLNKLAAALGAEMNFPGIRSVEDFSYSRKSRTSEAN